MRSHRLLTGLSLLAVSAFAQGPGPGRGPGHFGPPPGGPGARFLGAEAGPPGRVVKNAPYSADIVSETSQNLADGNHIRQSTTARFYRDSEGRTRSEQNVNLNGLASNSNLPQLVFINDPVAGVNFALNTKDKTATKSSAQPRGRGPRGGFAGPPPDPAQAGPPRRVSGDFAVKTEALGKQTIEGVQAEGTRHTMTIPAGQMGNDLPIQVVTERWYSADLQTEVLYKHTDPRTGETVRKLTNISRSEPSRTLFDAPSDYKVTERASRQ